MEDVPIIALILLDRTLALATVDMSWLMIKEPVVVSIHILYSTLHFQTI